MDKKWNGISELNEEPWGEVGESTESSNAELEECMEGITWYQDEEFEPSAESVEEEDDQDDQGDATEQAPAVTAPPNRPAALQKKRARPSLTVPGVLQPPRDSAGRLRLNGRQRFMLLDLWLRSGLSGTDYSGLVGISKGALHKWKAAFEAQGLVGLEDKPRRDRGTGSRLDEVTKRAILLLKEQHPEWGVDRLHDVLYRSEGFRASPGAISRLLKENGYEPVLLPTKPHPDKVRRFERARPNSLWQTDLFTFVLKRQNRRIHLVVFMDDHSRFIVAYGIGASPTTELVIQTVEGGIASYGPPEEILTDNGPQYVTWRGKSKFTRHLEKRGIKQLLARPRRPQTLGKVERFWKTFWAECAGIGIFKDVEDARIRTGHFIDYYNFQRPHQGLDGLVPADRYFEAAPQVRKSLEERVAQNAIDIAKHGEPRKTFYLTGRVGDESISLHAEGSKVVLTKDGQPRETVDLSATGKRIEPAGDPVAPSPTVTPADQITVEADNAPSVPGASPIDEALETLRASFEGDDDTADPSVEDDEEVGQ